jgi:NAD(P)-dependent dehydrogenase (short-subunit alcohol dehydrogenase family)
MTYILTMHEQFTTTRAPEEAFDYIVDFSKIHEWDHTIVESKKVTDGLIGLGSGFDLLYKMGLRKLPISYQITEFTPSTHAVLVGESDNFTAIDTVSISATEGGCHVDWHAEITFRGLSAKIIPLIQKKVKSAGMQTIRDLKTALDDNFDAPKLSALKSVADKLILPGVLSFSKYGYSNSQKHWRPVSQSIKGQHIVITGATSGLGLASAYELAHRGAHLTLVARSKAKAKEVVRDIKLITGNSNIAVEISDLSIMKEVTSLGKRLLKKDRAIDVLINNAGALLNPRQETSEGLEASFALLLLSPYILTTQLQPLLKASGHARVINVSSGGMYAKRLSVSNLQSTKGAYSGSDAYARSKRGLVITGEQWSKEWAGDGITVHNMHPGWAHTPGVELGLPEFTKLTKSILRTPEQGADTIIWLASANEVGKTTGLFWLDRTPHSTHLSSKTKEKAANRLELRSELDRLSRLFGL